MRITVNECNREIADDTTLAELITSIAGTSRGSAAVVDGAVVPRSAWPDTALREGQSVELITAVQGG